MRGFRAAFKSPADDGFLLFLIMIFIFTFVNGGRVLDMKSPTEIWDECLALLPTEIDALAVATWFDDASPVDFTDGVFFLFTPNSLKKDIISERFTEPVEKLLSILAGEKVTLSILCGQDELDGYTDGKIDGEVPAAVEYEYTFDNFIVGSSNRFGHAAALAVSRNPGKAYNPLFIYGQSGLGKTHLIYAIANEVKKEIKNCRVVYVKGDEFTNQLISSIQENSVAEFRNKYRMADLLLVDDIQFIAGKERTQEEFFHTFNTLYEAKKQIVLTSDRAPNEMMTLEDRLRTRFVCGLLADIQPPDYETRMAIISAKAKALNITLSDEISAFIASSITKNVRQLEGAVKKIAAMHDLLNKDITIDLAEAAVRDIFTKNPGLHPTPDLIISTVSEFYGITKDKITGNSRAKEAVVPRQIAMFLVREMTDLSLPDIGKTFGRDHSTVLYSINKIESEIARDENLKNSVNDVKKSVREK